MLICIVLLVKCSCLHHVVQKMLFPILTINIFSLHQIPNGIKIQSLISPAHSESHLETIQTELNQGCFYTLSALLEGLNEKIEVNWGESVEWKVLITWLCVRNIPKCCKHCKLFVILSFGLWTTEKGCSMSHFFLSNKQLFTWPLFIFDWSYNHPHIDLFVWDSKSH